MQHLRYLTLAFFLPAVALAGDLRLEFHPGGSPSERSSQAPPTKLTRTAPAVVLPYYLVDSNNASGLTTLFAVRNGSDEAVTVRYSYFAPQDGPLAPSLVEVATLAARDTRTVNLRDIPSLPVSDGSRSGYMIAQVIDATTGEPVNDSTALSGDYFRVDPANAFASGGALLSIGPLNLSFDLCSSWNLRFLNGGGFDGGTDVTFYLAFNPGSETPAVTGNVYDENGAFQGTLAVSTSDHAFEISSLDLALPVPFGTVEWVFAEGLLGHVSGTFRASGLYSVGVPAICADALVDVELDTIQALTAQTASLPADLVQAIFGLSLLTISDNAPLQFDPETGYWSGSFELDGVTLELEIQLRNAQGEVQQNYNPLTTDSIAARGNAGIDDTTLEFDLTLTGAATTASALTVDGVGNVTTTELAGTLQIQDLVVPKDADEFPQGGVITFSTTGITILIAFDGSQLAQVTASVFGTLQTFAVDLETGQIVP